MLSYSREITALRASTFSIGQLSKATGVHIETIRYYEKIGIIPEPPRSRGGQRQYDEDGLRRLGFVSRSRQLGFSLAEIRTLLALIDGEGITCADVRKLTLSHAARARRKIEDLERLEAALKLMAARCHGEEVPDCPIVDALLDVDAGTQG